MAPHSSTLAWKISWTEEPGRLESIGSRRVRHLLRDFTFTFHFHALEKEMAIHSSVLAWRIPGTGEPGGLLSMGLHKVGHNWSDLAVAAAYIPLNLPLNQFRCTIQFIQNVVQPFPPSVCRPSSSSQTETPYALNSNYLPPFLQSLLTLILLSVSEFYKWVDRTFVLSAVFFYVNIF